MATALQPALALAPLTGVAVLGALEVVGDAEEAAVALAAGALEVQEALGLDPREQQELDAQQRLEGEGAVLDRDLAGVVPLGEAQAGFGAELGVGGRGGVGRSRGRGGRQGAKCSRVVVGGAAWQSMAPARGPQAARAGMKPAVGDAHRGKQDAGHAQHRPAAVLQLSLHHPVD
jgi:hypothetical protein